MAAVDQVVPGAYTFTRYIRVVLPLDGFVFWVRSNLLSPSALLNALEMNQGPEAIFNSSTGTPIPVTTSVKGTLHYNTTVNQDDDKTYASNIVHFNTMIDGVQELNFPSPKMMWVGDFGRLGKFAFSYRDNYFQPANEKHYVGRGLYPQMASQIVDTIADFNRTQVVSNSLPIWLSLNGYAPGYGFGNPTLELFPAGLVEANLEPPFASVDVVADATTGLQASPYLSSNLSHYQLARDLVRVTFYGVRNDAVMDFMDCVNQFTLDTDLMGLMNIPIVRDEREKQTEFLVLAQKKYAEFEISYYQNRARNTARQLILQVIPTYEPGD